MDTENEQQAQFDAICAQLDEFEPLPEVLAPPKDPAHEQNEDEQREPLDGLILAGLVSP